MSAPIDERAYTYGPTVVDIGDLRVARGMSRRALSGCQHARLVYDTNERRVWCKDCETDVEAFDAFKLLVERSDHIEKRIAHMREVEAFTLRSRAAKAFDEAWRSRKMAPCCPHCSAAILPEDVGKRLALTNREWEERRRTKETS